MKLYIMTACPSRWSVVQASARALALFMFRASLSMASSSAPCVVERCTHTTVRLLRLHRHALSVALDVLLNAMRFVQHMAVAVVAHVNA